MKTLQNNWRCSRCFICFCTTWKNLFYEYECYM